MLSSVCRDGQFARLKTPMVRNDPAGRFNRFMLVRLLLSDAQAARLCKTVDAVRCGIKNSGSKNAEKPFLFLQDGGCSWEGRKFWIGRRGVVILQPICFR